MGNLCRGVNFREVNCIDSNNQITLVARGTEWKPQITIDLKLVAHGLYMVVLHFRWLYKRTKEIFFLSYLFFFLLKYIHTWKITRKNCSIWPLKIFTHSFTKNKTLPTNFAQIEKYRMLENMVSFSL